MLTTRAVALILICLGLNAGLVLFVASGRGTLLPLSIYLLAVATCIAAIYSATADRSKRAKNDGLTGVDLAVVAAIMGAQLVALLYITSFPYHYVQDEFITGYTTYTLGPLSEIHWFAGYPEPGAWIAGFPILYYALQAPFIELVGLSLETIRISTWPYHLLTAGMVYLLGREVFADRVWAVSGAVAYIALAPNLYMAGYGMHNISSTFFFLAALYCAVLMVKRDNRTWAIACGLFATMGYLTYVSSYLTVPLILLFVLITAIARRSRRPFELFAIVLVVVVVGLVPFVTYALTHDNYFTQRGDHVNAIAEFYGGDGGETGEATEQFFDHLATNFRSLYTPGIGGVTDYWFGKQALFDWLTLLLLAAGLGLAAYRGFARGEPLLLAIVATVLATFLFGMFLTLPAGGFHRATLAFPFVALLIVLSIHALASLVPKIFKPPAFRVAIPAAILAVFLVINVLSVRTMVREDEEISSLTDSVPITEFIEENVQPGTPVLISAFPNYHLERELIVRTGDEYDVNIRPFDDVVDEAGQSVVVLFQPDEAQIHRLEARYGDGQFVDAVGGVDLRRHRIFVTSAVAGQR
jgi:hypothetical protein